MNKVYLQLKKERKKTIKKMQRGMIFIFLVKYIYFYTYINYNSYKKHYLLFIDILENE